MSKTGKNHENMKGSATPIKEELIEEDFDDMNSNSRTVGMDQFVEAKNYDSMMSDSRDETKKSILKKSGDKTHDSGKTI